jgi:hypothetical protein
MQIILHSGQYLPHDLKLAFLCQQAIFHSHQGNPPAVLPPAFPPVPFLPLLHQKQILVFHDTLRETSGKLTYETEQPLQSLAVC